MDMTHLNALEVRLSNERGYLAQARTAKEQRLRTVWIAQIEKEIKGEKRFLGIVDHAEPEVSDDDLLAMLGI